MKIFRELKQQLHFGKHMTMTTYLASTTMRKKKLILSELARKKPKFMAKTFAKNFRSRFKSKFLFL